MSAARVWGPALLMPSLAMHWGTQCILPQHPASRSTNVPSDLLPGVVRRLAPCVPAAAGSDWHYPDQLPALLICQSICTPSAAQPAPCHTSLQGAVLESPKSARAYSKTKLLTRRSLLCFVGPTCGGG